MTINMNTVISNMRAMKGKVTYSMLGSRTGADGTADCSGSVYTSLNKAGANLSLGNTDSLFVDLPKIGFKKINKPYKYGDIFIFGVKGQSSGANGHTGIFLSADQIIHCNFAANGISIDNFQKVWEYDYKPPLSVYRLQTSETKPTKDADKQENTSANMDNCGELEEYSYIGQRLCVKGWHYASPTTNSSDDSGGSSSGGGSEGGFSDGDLVNSGYRMSNENINSLLKYARQRDIMPSFMITQMFFESHWGDPNTSLVGSVDNNWSGISEPFTPPKGITVTRGTQRAEGGYYVHFKNLDDYFNTFVFILSEENGLYHTQGKKTLSEYVKGLFKVGGANANYAASGYEHYLTNMQACYNAIKAQNPGKLEKIDELLSSINKIQMKASSKTNKIEKAKAHEVIEIYNAITDKRLITIPVELKKREDIKERFEEVEGIEWCGIDICIFGEYSDPFYLKFVRIDTNGTRYELCLRALFFPHSSSRANIGHDFSLDRGFLIECINKNGKTQYINDILSGISWTIEPNEIPSCSLIVPIHEVDKFDGHMDVRIIIFGKMFDGIVRQIDLDHINNTANIQLDHKIAEWEYRQIPNNYTVKNETIPSIFCQSPFLYSTDWYVDCDGSAQKQKVNYAFSRQSHLEALNKVVELTDSIWWRVGCRYDRYLEIGAFGTKKQYIVSVNGSTERHLQIIGDIKVIKAFDGVFNVATVYGEKSDSSQASLTLREAYLAQQQQKHDITKGFPIVILNPTTNKEQKNYYTNITKIASNNSLEYAVLDEFGIHLEQGKLIEKTIGLNDLAPFEENGKEISDEERAKQARIAYDVAVRRLKMARRCEEITVEVGVLPNDVNVLDKIYFDYTGIVQLFDGCSRYCKKFYEASSDFYITKIETTFDENLNETNKLTLRKELKRDDFNY